MRGISKLLLFDKGVVGKPVEELGPIRPDDVGLRIMDVGVDEAGHDERSDVIVDDRARRRAPENIVRLADRLNQSAGDENSAVLDEGAGARAPQGRMSLSLSVAIRSISASAIVVSASASLATRSRKAARMLAVVLPLTAMMK